MAEREPLPRIIAHRGGRYWERDNFRYISESVREGADIIELDVRLNQDGRYIVQHDQFSRSQGYLDDALPRLEDADLYLDIKSNRIDVNRLIAHVRDRCSNHLIVGSFDATLLRRIGAPGVERNYHCVLPWRALLDGASVRASWINPLCYFATESVAREVQQAGYKFVPSGNPILKRYEVMDNQVRFAQWGAYAVSTYHVKEMIVRLLEAQ